MENNKIEKKIEIKAPLARVWKALTDSQQFGTWFRVKIEGPFVVGQLSVGQIQVPGFEHIKWHSTVKAMKEPSYFAYTWHPYAVDPNVDYTKETPTLVEFFLKEIPTGTELTVIESGFENVPAHRRSEAFRMNNGGWEAQLKNIDKYAAQNT